MRQSKRTFVIGDVQGCLYALKALLEKIEYHPDTTQLWFTGDLINRGSQSLETLRFIMNLPDSTICVLGNHDLALLVASFGYIHPGPKDTYQEILFAPDKDHLLEWLRQRPLLHHDPTQQVVMTHAGIYPWWDLNKAKQLAKEVEQALRGPHYAEFLQQLFGNQPTRWADALQGWDRLRFITNVFTRMRFCRSDGNLDFTAKGSLADFPSLIPWFAWPNRIVIDEMLLFGHWAALGGKCNVSNIYPLDTGCVWGNCLTAFSLKSKEHVTIDCSQYLR